MKNKILIVEDDHDIATALRDRLEMLGFEIETADDGVSALERLEETQPDLMLLDLHLPRLSGFEVLEHMAARRTQASSPYDVPVIIMSAFVGAKTAAMALHARVRGFVGKPFEWKKFFGIMEQVVREHAWKASSGTEPDRDEP